MRGYCYVFEGATRFKFGFSAAPWVRLTSINQDSDEPMRMVGYAHGSNMQEARLHELLRDYRIEGEWYRRCPLIEAVAALFPRKDKLTRASRCGMRHCNEATALEAKQLLSTMIAGGERMTAAFPRLAADLGLPPRRIRAIWYMEAQAILPAEIEGLRARSVQLRGLADGGEVAR